MSAPIHIYGLIIHIHTCSKCLASTVKQKIHLLWSVSFFLDNYMQKAKKTFADGRSGRNRNLNRINDELQDVQKIMIQNIDDVLQRGENLSGKIFLFFILDVSAFRSIIFVSVIARLLYVLREILVQCLLQYLLKDLL